MYYDNLGNITCTANERLTGHQGLLFTWPCKLLINKVNGSEKFDSFQINVLSSASFNNMFKSTVVFTLVNNF